jgi:hypothetical protein
MNEKLKFIDKAGPHETLGKASATVRQDVLAGLLFQASDLLGKIATATTASAQIVALEGGKYRNFKRPFLLTMKSTAG